MANIVYHYTSPEGIFEILKNKTLWFSDSQYLNDKSELVYISEPFIEAYRRLCIERGESLDNIENFADSMCKTYAYQDFDLDSVKREGKIFSRGFPSEYRYYILSASYAQDTASMWNYYIKNGMYQGYNLGMDINIIEDWFSKNESSKIKLVHGKVIYDKDEQIEMLYNKIKELKIPFDERKPYFDNEEIEFYAIDDFQNDLGEFINDHKLFFKKPAFEYEKEYRFILKVHNDFEADDYFKKDFRVGSSGIITPYIEWKFEKIKPLLIKQITLAPMIEEELARESFESFLLKEVKEHINIVQSSIKLRF